MAFQSISIGKLVKKSIKKDFFNDELILGLIAGPRRASIQIF